MAFQDFLIGALVLLVGAAFCFVGYQFFRILIAIWGFFAGFNLGAGAMTALFHNAFLATTTGIVLGLVLGVVFAALAYFFYYIAVVLLGASSDLNRHRPHGSHRVKPSGFVSVIVGIVVAVVLALIILLFNLPKLLIMVFTAIGGAVAMVAGVLMLFGKIHVTSLQYGVAVAVAELRTEWFWSIVAIALAVVGFLAQWRINQEYTMEWSQSKV